MRFSHSGSLGDVIYALPTLKALNDKHGGEAELYLRCGVPAAYYAGARHPLGGVRLSEAYARSLVPLLQAQPYLAHAGLWDGQEVDVDLDLFRLTAVDFSRGSLPNYYAFAWDVDFDLSKPWLAVEPDLKFSDRLVVNRTSRYQNPRVRYDFLRDYHPVFVGLPEEFAEFIRDVPIATYQPTPDFLSLARVIAGSRAFVGNQSFAFAVAEALKVPRVLETCLWCPNVIPCGLGGRAVVNQIGFETIVGNLMGVG